MRSIAFRLWITLISLVAAVLVLLWLFQIVFLEQFYTQIRINDIKSAGVEIAELVAKGERAAIQNKLDELAYNNNITAEILDNQYNTLYSSGDAGATGSMPMMRNRVRSDVYTDVFSGKFASVTITHPRFNSSFMLIGIPIEIDKSIRAGIFIDLPLVEVNAAASILKRQLLYVTAILMIISVILTILISRSFTKPILDINRVAMSMAAGNLSARINMKRKDEIGMLGDTINHTGEELEKIEKLRKDLIANVSHELKTPISLIKGYAETIKDVTGDIKDKREKQLDIIIDEADRLNEMVMEILQFSQMQAGYIKLDRHSFMINKMLEKAYKRFEILAAKEGIALELSAGSDATVYADEAKIEQVIYNFLNNAINHSVEGGTISLSLVESPDVIKIEVSDTGEGIAESDIPYIWDRFYKADKSGVKKKAGTGLGLSIAKNILEAHNCKYGVESNLGHGAKFWFEFKKS